MAVVETIALALMLAPLVKGGFHDLQRKFGGQSDEPGLMDAIFGTSGRAVDPLGVAGREAGSLLAQRLGSQADLASNPIFNQSLAGLQSLLGGQTLSQYLEPAMRAYREQIVPQLASQAMSGSMSRGRSALPAYLTQASDRMGQQALSTQAQLMPNALQQLFNASQAPLDATVSALGALGSGRSGMMQGQAMPSALASIAGNDKALNAIASFFSETPPESVGAIGAK